MFSLRRQILDCAFYDYPFTDLQICKECNRQWMCFRHKATLPYKLAHPTTRPIKQKLF